MTGAAILVFRASTSLQAAPAAWPYRWAGVAIVSFHDLAQIGSLSEGQRLYSFELLAHYLTVVVRVISSDWEISDAEKVERIKGVNEILHRVTAKVWALRLRTQEWSEEAIAEVMSSGVL